MDLTFSQLCQAFFIICYAFVNYTDIIHAAASNSVKGEEVIGQMQDILDRWGGLLRATGGALVPKKSYWLVGDQFQVDGFRLVIPNYRRHAR
jgi:hypothetical protein